MRGGPRRVSRDVLSVLLVLVAGAIALAAALLVSTAGQTYLQVLFD
jgi:hypothetical protein